MSHARIVLRSTWTTAAGVVGALALVVASLVVPATGAAAAVDPCVVGGNPIVCENSKPGTDPNVWDIAGIGDPSIQGFGTDISVNVGARIDFKIKTNAAAYTVDIYRTGWYGGLGARKITTVPVTATLPQTQPACVSNAATALYDCGNWAVSSGWNVPSTAVSGVYVALLRRTDTGGESHIIFVVRNDASTSAVVLQTSDTTWQAYNSYGGANFYSGGAQGRAYKLSYNRPFATRGGIEARDFYFGAEYPMARFLERNGYDVTYQSGVDTARAGALLLNHKVFVSVGHDEYWSGPQRANVEAARDAGVSLAFFSGNEVYWKTRYENSVAGASTSYRTLVSYKETWANAKIDPSTEWTGTWRDPRYAPTSAGAGRPENGLTGTLYMSNASDLPVTVSAEEGKLRIWRGTSLAGLAAGSIAALAPHTVGYESNDDLDNGSRPAGLIRLSTVSGAVSQYMQDFGNTVAPGTTTHHMTLYRAASGALVFSAGSIQWTWGLDQTHDGAGAPADSRMQQATINLLADMNAQPDSLMAGLLAAAGSTDATAPSATITAPAAGAAVANGASVTTTGTATDVGGRVAGVEVSTDGGTTWHPATGTASWSYTYQQTGVGAVPIQARAIDDSANIGAPSAARSVTVSCPCSVFGETVPAVPATSDAGAVELGLRVTPSTAGFISGVRFYKGTGNGGTHTGSLWNTSGQRLATVTFAGESATGWQTATFAAPVSVAAGQTYVVSYTAPQGRYAAAADFFASSGVSSPPLSAAGGYGAVYAGVYGNPGAFPGSTYRSSNYYVDAMFTTSSGTALTVVSTSPLAGATSVALSAPVTATFSTAVEAGSASLAVSTSAGAAVAGTTTYDPTTVTVRFVPSAAYAVSTTYTATADARDTLGAGVTGSRSWTFTTAAAAPQPGACPCSLFDDATLPAVLEAADPGPVSLGVRFASSLDGAVTAVRFYKGPNNTGTHTGALWSASGQQLAAATFTNESATGWQTVTFAQPVAIAKDTEYYASYRAPNGRYSLTLGELADGLVRTPLRVGTNGGAYSYPDAAPTAPSSTNYLVDVVFAPSVVAPFAVSTSPAAGAIGSAVGDPVSATYSEAIKPGAVVALTTGGTPVAGATTLAADQRTVSFQPSAALTAGTVYAVTVSGVASLAGVAAAAVNWSFTTAGTGASGCPCSLFATETPVTAASTDRAAVELGVAFVPASNGSVTGVRFYKGTGNGGTHTGSLWSAAGARLATVTFTNEGATGWQTATFAQPVAVTQGATYVVSYLAPQGRYAFTQNYFTAAKVTGPLTAPAAGNGRYVYGGGFPTRTWNAANYFVDVVFTTTATPPPTPPTVTAVTPVSGATGVAVTVAPTATLSAVPAVGTPTLALSGPGGAIAGTSAFNATAGVVTFTPAAALPASTVIAAATTLAGAALAGGAWSFTTAAAPPAPAPTVTAVSPLAGAAGVAVTSQVTATLSGLPASGTPTLALTGPGGAIAGTSAFDTTTRVVTFTPGAALPFATVVSAATTLAGTALAGGAWSFTTAAAPPAPAPTVTAVSPLAGAAGVAVTSQVTATLSGLPASGTPTLALTGPGGAIAGTSAFDTTTRVVTFTPGAALPFATVVSAATTLAGTALAGGAWSFTTVAAPVGGCPCSLWSDADVPATANWNDPNPVQVGVRFTAAVPGTVSGVRFYKGPTNTGAHTVNLWNAAGTRLATATATGESASGWQTVLFTPVAISAGQTYTASYYTTSGRYAATLGTLAAVRTTGPLSTVANGGAYVYGTGFPGNSASHNYWVDILFTPSP